MKLAPALGRASTRIGAGLLVVAALAVGRLVTDLAPEGDGGEQPFERHGGVGDTISLRYGTVRATEVEGANQLFRTSSGYISPSLWLVVTVEFTPLQDNRVPAFAQVRGGDGTVISDGPRNAFQCDPGNPGITVRCGAAFEVPDAALPGAELVLAQDNSQDQRFDDLAVIDLGVERRDVVRWRTVTEPLTFPLDREDR